MSKPLNTLIVVLGPTAIGKTQLAIELAGHFKTEIISADSRQFYKEMEIGTAKPGRQELKKATHHFISSHSITDEFSVGQFETQALHILDQVFKTSDNAIMVGGSGLYLQAVCEGFDDIPSADPSIRKNLNDLLEKEGIKVLQERLKVADREYYDNVDLNNPQRIIRALEVWESTGKSFSSYRINNHKQRPFNIIKIGLNISRDELYNRINNRVDVMIQNGLLEEVKSLHLYKQLNALKTVGYAELFDHLSGLISLEDAIEKIKQNTRRFAKRQLTWFRRQKDIEWFELNQVPEIIDYLHQHIHPNLEPLGQRS